GFGRLAGQRPHGRDHAAVVLEVVVGVGDVVLAGVDVLGGDRDPPVGVLHVGAGGDAVEVAAVGVAAPHRVHLGEVGVVAPVAAVDERQQPRPVRARRRPEHAQRGAALVAVLARVGLDVGADVVGVVGFVQAGDEP